MRESEIKYTREELSEAYRITKHKLDVILEISLALRKNFVVPETPLERLCWLADNADYRDWKALYRKEDATSISDLIDLLSGEDWQRSIAMAAAGQTRAPGKISTVPSGHKLL